MITPSCPKVAALPGWRTIAARGNAYPESIFAPASALGAPEAFTIGIQLLDQQTNPDNTSVVQVEYYDVPAAPKQPLISQYIAVAMAGGASRLFTSAITLGAAGEWDTPLTAVTAVLKPYTTYFTAQYGSKPAYCPSGAINAGFEQNEKNFNRTYCKEPGCETYKPGSSFYTDNLQIDRVLTIMPPAGMDKLIVWQGQIYSSLITENNQQYEFNPNSDILDPNLDQCCKGPWANVTSTLKKKKIGLGWFGRPCSHIMRTDDPTKSASMDCPSKLIHKGVPTPCDLRYLGQPCSKSSMDTVDALVKNGVTAFYWDSYLCEGRMTFSQAVMKKYPHVFVMGEQGVDVDSIVISGLPWMGMQAGVWDPGFEPLNSVLQTIVNPMGTAIVGAFGADQNYNHSTYSLAASKSNSWIDFGWSNGTGKPGSRAAVTKAVNCNQIMMSYKNTLWRMQQYGTKQGCPAPLKPDLKALKCPPAESGIYVDVDNLLPNQTLVDAVTAALAAAKAWAAAGPLDRERRRATEKTDDTAAAGLQVDYNSTDGNATLSFGGQRVVAGLPTFWCLGADGETVGGKLSDGTAIWGWAHSGPDGGSSKPIAAYDDASKTYSQAHIWGSWSVQHKTSAHSLDLEITVTNTYNKSHGGNGDLKGVTLSLFGRVGST